MGYEAFSGIPGRQEIVANNSEREQVVAIFYRRLNVTQVRLG